MKQPLERPMKQPLEWTMKQPLERPSHFAFPSRRVCIAPCHLESIRRHTRRQRPRSDPPNAALRGAGRQSRWSGRWKSRGPPAASLVLSQDGVAGSSRTYKIMLISC